MVEITTMSASASLGQATATTTTATTASSVSHSHSRGRSHSHAHRHASSQSTTVSASNWANTMPLVSSDSKTQLRITQCMQMLQGKSDEHKFAGLLMVTRLEGLSPHQMQQLRQEIFQVVGVKFFFRLLHTKSNTGTAGEPSVYQMLGLNLIASFCQDAELVDMFAHERLMRLVYEKLTSPMSPSTMKDDCLHILQSFIHSRKGKDVLLHENLLGRLLIAVRKLLQQTALATNGSVIANASIPKSNEQKANNSPPTVPTVATQQQSTTKPPFLGASCSKQDASINATNAMLAAMAHNNNQNVLPTLWSILQFLSVDEEFWGRMRSNDFEFLCGAFARGRQEDAQVLLDLLNHYMNLVEECKISEELLSSTSLLDLRTGIFRFLRTHHGQRQKDACFMLIYLLMRNIGASWMFAGRLSPPREEVDGKFCLFCLKLVTVEVKLMLDEIELSLIVMDDQEPKEISLSERKRRQEEVQHVLHLLPICYGIVEMITSGLTSGNHNSTCTSASDEDDEGEMPLPLPVEALLEVRQSLKELFMVVFGFLKIARDYMRTNRFMELETLGSPSLRQLDAVIYATVRFGGSCIADDADSYEDQIVELIPFLIQYQPHIIGSESGSSPATTFSEELDSDDEIQSDTGIEPFIDRLEATVVEKSPLQSEDPKLLTDTMHFLLPGLVHVTATPRVAKTIARSLEVVRRLMRFCCTICSSMASDDASYESIGELTLCLGVLINLLTKGTDENDKLNNCIEWCRSLGFLLPVVCTSSTQVMDDTDLPEECRGEDDRYLMILHLVALILLINSRMQQQEEGSCCSFSSAIHELVNPFQSVVEWTLANPPDTKSDAYSMFELIRTLAMGSWSNGLRFSLGRDESLQ